MSSNFYCLNFETPVRKKELSTDQSDYVFVTLIAPDFLQLSQSLAFQQLNISVSLTSASTKISRKYLYINLKENKKTYIHLRFTKVISMGINTRHIYMQYGAKAHMSETKRELPNLLVIKLCHECTEHMPIS